MSNVMDSLPVVKFLGMDCEIEKDFYRNKQPALQLVAADTPANLEQDLFEGEPVLIATVCLDYPFEEGETAIKDWSENEGICNVLIDAKIIKLTGKFTQSGYCTVPIVKLLI